MESFGRYNLVDFIASGGMADVYRAEAPGAAGFVKELAIKVIRGDFSDRPELVEMFKQEARLASKLSHANIVQVFDFDEIDGRYYIAMEFVQGRTLGHLVNRCRSAAVELGLPKAVQICAQVATALAFAHRQKEKGRPSGIVHRDISPQNVLISFEGEVKLTDFGIARVMNAAGLTRPGIVKGKPAYMAPEQARGWEVDGRADVWALGVVLWELCCGFNLFERETESASLFAVVGPDPEILPPSRWNSQVPPELDAAVLGALERDLQRRTPSAEEFATQLQSVLFKLVKDPRDLDLRGLVQKLWPDGATATGTGRVPTVNGPTPQSFPRGPTPPRGRTPASGPRAPTPAGPRASTPGSRPRAATPAALPKTLPLQPAPTPPGESPAIQGAEPDPALAFGPAVSATPESRPAKPFPKTAVLVDPLDLHPGEAADPLQPVPAPPGDLPAMEGAEQDPTPPFDPAVSATPESRPAKPFPKTAVLVDPLDSHSGDVADPLSLGLSCEVSALGHDSSPARPSARPDTPARGQPGSSPGKRGSTPAAARTTPAPRTPYPPIPEPEPMPRPALAPATPAPDRSPPVLRQPAALGGRSRGSRRRLAALTAGAVVLAGVGLAAAIHFSTTPRPPERITNPLPQPPAEPPREPAKPEPQVAVTPPPAPPTGQPASPTPAPSPAPPANPEPAARPATAARPQATVPATSPGVAHAAPVKKPDDTEKTKPPKKPAQHSANASSPGDPKQPKQKPAPVARATLRVFSTTWAIIFVDDEKAGFTPVTLSLPPGPHKLRAEHEGLAPVEHTVTLEPGETHRWSPQLKPAGE